MANPEQLATGEINRLKEKIVNEALAKLDWEPLARHLDTVNLNEECVAELLGHMRKSTDLLLKRPDSKRAAARATFIDELLQYLSARAEKGASAKLQNMMMMLGHIEAGYSEILRTLSRSSAAKMPPEIQASAALFRSAYAYHELAEAVDATAARSKELTLQSFRIKMADGSSYSPDGILAAIIATATMTLHLLGHQNKWFNSSRHLVLPELPSISQENVYKAGATEVLAAIWRHWERMEQRCRYFEGELHVYTSDNLPPWAPKEARKAIEYNHISEAELFDYFANERLNDRLIQTFQEMSLETNAFNQVSGISEPAALLPIKFVSAQEAHSAISLSEILGYSIIDDQERPCGLRLLEWIRGYATLQCLASERYIQQGRDGLYFRIDRADLVAHLDRLGLKNGTADVFIDQTTLRADSRDLFDQPLVCLQDGGLLLFGPAILNADPARLSLSAIGNQGEQLGRQGESV